MEVSKQNSDEPGGEELISTVVSLTGLPENLVHQELDTILQNTGHDSDNLTLDELRAAMIAYLESIHADFSAQGEQSDDVEPLPDSE